MTDTAEARERLEIALTWVPSPHRHPAREALAVLSARLAQAEQERDTAVATSNLACSTRDQQRKRADDLLARLREYEEALRRFTALCGEPGENPLNAGWDEANEFARAVLAEGTDG